MKRITCLLLLLTGMAGPAAHAREQPADSSDTPVQPADSTEDSAAGSQVPETGKDKGTTADDEEPDCE